VAARPAGDRPSKGAPNSRSPQPWAWSHWRVRAGTGLSAPELRWSQRVLGAAPTDPRLNRCDRGFGFQAQPSPIEGDCVCGNSGGRSGSSPEKHRFPCKRSRCSGRNTPLRATRLSDRREGEKQGTAQASVRTSRSAYGLVASSCLRTVIGFALQKVARDWHFFSEGPRSGLVRV
jgi:hypothetical protein